MNNDKTNSFGYKVFLATIIVFATTALLYMGYLARGPLMWIGIATFFAIALNPTIKKVAKFMPKKNIAAATLVVMIGLLAFFALLTTYLMAPLVNQTVKLASEVPALIDNISKLIVSAPGGHTLNISSDTITSYIRSNIDNLLSSASEVGKVLLGIIVGIINSIVAVVAIISLIFFMTVEADRWKNVAISLFATRHQKRVSDIGEKVYKIINGYVIGNIILSIMYGLASALVLWIMKSPYFLPLGLLTGLIDLIPLVGSTIGAIIVVIISLLSGELWTAIVYVIFSLLYVQVENNVLNPAIYSKNVDVSPLIVLASILIGASVGGIIGALLAIPVAASIQVIGRELLKGRIVSK